MTTGSIYSLLPTNYSMNLLNLRVVTGTNVVAPLSLGVQCLKFQWNEHNKTKTGVRFMLYSFCDSPVPSFFIFDGVSHRIPLDFVCSVCLQKLPGVVSDQYGPCISIYGDCWTVSEWISPVERLVPFHHMIDQVIKVHGAAVELCW